MIFLNNDKLKLNELGAEESMSILRAFQTKSNGLEINSLSGTWCKVSVFNCILVDAVYRIVQPTITLRGVEFDEPQREPLPQGAVYYHVNLERGIDRKSILKWDGCELDVDRLNAGLIQLKLSSAEKQREAMLRSIGAF